jgi:hypothetical protein
MSDDERIDFLEKLSAETNKRCPWRLLGRVVGTATGWDQVDHDEIALYDFEPCPFLVPWLPKGDVSFNWTEGLAKYYDPDTGDVKQRVDLIPILAQMQWVEETDAEQPEDQIS